MKRLLYPVYSRNCLSISDYGLGRRLPRILRMNSDKKRSNPLTDDESISVTAHVITNNISKAALAKQSGMSEIYLHQIFAGRRNPSRNRLLCLCYGLGASIEEAQELLKLCGMAQLYPKLKRDAIIYYGLQHGLGLFEINDKLFDENEETLF